jgi:hypothetical protein
MKPFYILLFSAALAALALGQDATNHPPRFHRSRDNLATDFLAQRMGSTWAASNTVAGLDDNVKAVLADAGQRAAVDDYLNSNATKIVGTHLWTRAFAKSRNLTQWSGGVTGNVGDWSIIGLAPGGKVLIAPTGVVITQDARTITGLLPE